MNMVRFVPLLAALLLPSALFAAVETNTSTQKETGFEDGNLSPFNVCTTQNPNYVQAFTLNGRKCAKFYWTQVGYDGTRMDRGAEMCSTLAIYKEGWMGFQFYLPSPGFPTNKEQSIAQIFAENGCSSWAAMLVVRNNTLILQRRSACVSPTETVITSSIQRNVWVPVVIHFKVSRQNAGLLEIWYGSAASKQNSPTLRASNINLAWGQWTGDTLDATVPDNMIGLKVGMYNYQDTGYTVGENRTMYIDNLSQINGNPTNAWTLVNPLK